MSTNCACGETWRVELCDLKTGRIRTVAHPTSMSWTTELNRSGQGSMTLVAKELTVRDIWPGLTSVYILRTDGGDATPLNPIVEFAGMIEAFSVGDDGTVSVGMNALESYLHKRQINENVYYPPETPITLIGKELVERANVKGIPLEATYSASIQPKEKTYNSWDHKIIGEAIEELSDMIDGFDWIVSHYKNTQGEWRTSLHFQDYVGTVRDLVLKSDVEGVSYSLDVDAKDLATGITALGAGSEVDQVTYYIEDPADIYPLFEATPSWPSDTVDPADTEVIEEGEEDPEPTPEDMAALEANARGYLEDYQEPIAAPSITIMGMDPAPEHILLGDTISLLLNFGSIGYDGQARVMSKSWDVAVDAAPTRTYTLLPVTRASQSVFLGDFSEDGCCEPIVDTESEGGPYGAGPYGSGPYGG